MVGRRVQRGAMRSVFWLLALAAAAVALALLMGNNDSTVTLFWPPYRYDVSFNFFVAVSIAAFVVLYAALRALGLLRELPRQARRWRSQQLERAVVGSVLDALSHQLAGRFVRAQSAAQQALDQLGSSVAAEWPRRPQLRLLAHLLLAESAQSLQNRERRDEHLQAALNPKLVRHAPEAAEGAQLRAVRWAIEDHEVGAARERLAALPQGTQRRIQALRLKLRVAQLAHEPTEALDTARLLAKHRAFPPAAARSLVRGLALDTLRSARDLGQLQRLWSALDATERREPEIALAAARQAHGLLAAAAQAGDPAPMDGVRDWLAPVWERFDTLDDSQQRALVLAMEPALPWLDAAGLAELEQRQRRWPGNPHLQYLTGQACFQRQLWGKAAQLLGQARHGLSDPALLRRTWRSLAQLAEERGDEAAAQAAWKTAAQLD